MNKPTMRSGGAGHLQTSKRFPHCGRSGNDLVAGGPYGMSSGGSKPFLHVSGLILAVSLIALTFRPSFESDGLSIMFFGGIQLTLVVVFGAAVIWLRRVPARAAPNMRRVFPNWLIVIALVGSIAVTYNVVVITTDQAVQSLSVDPIASLNFGAHEDGRYFVRVNREREREITKSEYMALQRQSVGIFSCVWVALSLLALFLWNLIESRSETIGSSV